MSNYFYQFSGAYATNEARIQAEHEYDTLNYLTRETPLLYYNDFYINRGEILYDIVEFNDGFNFAISEKLKRILTENNVKGWDCFPIRIKNQENKYYGFQNLSEAGPILNLDQLNSYETENIDFDYHSWDGSDVFHLKDSGINVCTRRVKELFEKHKISNIEIRLL